MRSLILFIFLSSCSAVPRGPQSGYVITDYDSNGAVEKTYQVEQFTTDDDVVSFTDQGVRKKIKGSFKIEKIKP